jgi:hypothetical protein
MWKITNRLIMQPDYSEYWPGYRPVLLGSLTGQTRRCAPLPLIAEHNARDRTRLQKMSSISLIRQ